MKRAFWLLLAIVALRSAGFVFGVLNVDESDFMLFGQGIARGLLPYRDLVEIKPPLGYFTYLPTALFGPLNIVPIRVLGVLWVLATALLLRKAVLAWRGSEREGWAAAWLYLLATLCEVPSFGSEVMMNLPIAGGLYFFAREDNDFLAGVCLGIASLYRHQAAIAGVALGLVLLTRPLRLVALFLGSIAPWLAFAAYYRHIGQWPAFYEWVFTRNLSYAGPAGAGSALLRALQSTLLCVSATIVPWVLAVRQALRRGDSRQTAFTLLLVLTWLPVSLGGRFYEHYYLQFAPALAVLAAPIFADQLHRFRDLNPLPRALLAVGVALPVLISLGFSYMRGLTGHYPAQEPRALEMASAIRAHSDPSDTLFVWGHYTPIYVLAQRMPGTRYVNASPMMGNFDPSHLDNSFDALKHEQRADVQALLSDLEKNRTPLFLDTAPSNLHDWARIPLYPGIRAYIEAHYREIARPAGAILYARRPGQ